MRPNTPEEVHHSLLTHHLRPGIWSIQSYATPVHPLRKDTKVQGFGGLNESRPREKLGFLSLAILQGGNGVNCRGTGRGACAWARRAYNLRHAAHLIPTNCPASYLTRLGPAQFIPKTRAGHYERGLGEQERKRHAQGNLTRYEGSRGIRKRRRVKCERQGLHGALTALLELTGRSYVSPRQRWRSVVLLLLRWEL